MIRRCFRIVPLVWIATFAYLLLSGIGPGYYAPNLQVTTSDVIAQLLFVDAFIPRNSSIVPGGLTVSTEMFFYVLFPLFVFAFRDIRVVVIFLSLYLALLTYSFDDYFYFVSNSFSAIDPSMLAVWTSLSLPSQVPFFCQDFWCI